jgi:hypothetical protein
MKRTIYTALLVCSVILSGCIDITEEIFLERRGSGKYLSTIDLRQMKDMINMLKTMAPDSTKQEDGGELGGLEDSLQNMWKELETVPGITEVKREKKEEWVYVISFRFANLTALNEAMTKRKKPEEQQQSGNFYSFAPGIFSCNDTSLAGMNDVLKGTNQPAQKDSTQSDSTQLALSMMKSFMGDMKYTCVYHLPGKVSSFTNKKAKLSEDGKTVTLSINLLDDADSVKTLVNQIRYKK